MIISHKYKFVFIKTKKTAGSSIEKFLYPYLDQEQDMITGSEPDNTPQLNVPDRLVRFDGKIIGNSDWFSAKKIIGRDKFSDYYIFCVERNSWDKTISAYKFHRSLGHIDCSLDEFVHLDKIVNKKIKGVFHPIPCNWNLYTSNDKIRVDRVIQFDNLHQELQEVLTHLNIPANINDFNNIRLKQSESTKYTLSNKSIERIRQIFCKEIKQFNYQYTP